MPQLFHPSSNHLARIVLGLVVVLVPGLVWAANVIARSQFWTRVAVVREQPVPFSHDHHTAGLGIHCKYCHHTVDKSPSAGMPATEVCMGCHSQIWKDSPMLEPVRASYRSGQPIAWTRVYDLPDFVYFNHQAHVTAGVGCESCHGRVDRMPLMYRAVTLHMEWCLDCHRQPEQHLRPIDEIYTMGRETPPNQTALGHQLLGDYRINKSQLTDCSVCHR